MKKVTCLLVLLAMATSVSADVIFTGDGTGGKLSLSYTTTGGDLPRGFALKCVVQGGDTVTITPGDITVPGLDPCDLTNIDYAFTAVDGGGSYAIGEGHPLADPCNPGVLSPSTDIDYFSVCFGALDHTGNQGAGPATADPLIEIPMDVGSDPCGVLICIYEDNLRGGVAGSQLTTNLPICVTVVPIIDCFPSDHPDYSQWVLVGKPDCWCYPRQCHGDADNLSQGKQKYWVSTNDLAILVSAWQKPLAQCTGTDICADFAHDPQGKQGYRVSTNDLAILVANWQISNGPAPDCYTLPYP